GAVDLYGLDSYPQRFDCSHPDVWRPVVTNYHEYHARVNPSQPWYIPEFQAGSFDAWGPGAPGALFAACLRLKPREQCVICNRLRPLRRPDRPRFPVRVQPAALGEQREDD
ncbi:hypothetical protein C8R43DRAFT_1058218, partial [Mycena crocata]